jgi:hypothetical protein
MPSAGACYAPKTGRNAVPLPTPWQSPATDHLKAYQRSLQLRADMAARESSPAALADTVCNSEALATIVRHHELFSSAAAAAGMRVDDEVLPFMQASDAGTLNVAKFLAWSQSDVNKQYVRERHLWRFRPQQQDYFPRCIRPNFQRWEPGQIPK